MPKAVKDKKDASPCPVCGCACLPSVDGVKWCHECMDAITQFCVGGMASETSPESVVTQAVMVRIATIQRSRGIMDSTAGSSGDNVDASTDAGGLL